MKLGCQSEPTNDQHLKYLARYGVRNICGYPVIADGRLYATVEELHRMQDLARANGIQVDMTTPPFLASISVDEDQHASIMLGESPQRDRDIEDLQTMIKNCATAGIPAIKYNLQIVGDLRTGRSAGPRRRDIQHLETSGSKTENAVDTCRSRKRRHGLGAHHVLP